MGGVSLLDENLVILSSNLSLLSDSPSPPPPPPPPPPFPLMIIGKQYSLKKAQKNDPYLGSQPIVSLAEILKIRQQLRTREQTDPLTLEKQ